VHRPGRTIRADIRLDIRKITEVRAFTDIRSKPRSQIRCTDFRMVTNIRAKFTTDIRACTDNSTRTSVILPISGRTVQPGRYVEAYDIPHCHIVDVT